jgi:hypothetical protein
MNINGFPIQEQLVSGTSIKTLNNINLLNGGNANLNSAISQLKLSLIDTTNGLPVTGLSTTMTYAALIPANTFTTDGFLDLTTRFNKVGTGSNWTIRIGKNTIPSLTGSVALSTIVSPSSSTNIYLQGNRFYRLTGGRIYGMTSNQVSFTDTMQTGTIESNTTFVLSVDNYLIISIQLFLTSSDVASTTFVKLLGYE